MNLKAEKMDELLTLGEQNQLLEDLLSMEALVVGHQEYLKSIGKLEEGKMFVRKFMSNLQNDDLLKYFKKRG